jgi:hypothetical protein
LSAACLLRSVQGQISRSKVRETACIPVLKLLFCHTNRFRTYTVKSATSATQNNQKKKQVLRRCRRRSLRLFFSPLPSLIAVLRVTHDEKQLKKVTNIYRCLRKLLLENKAIFNFQSGVGQEVRQIWFY